jgi:uncharacterized protein YbjT (DUF2867 family)
MKIVIIGGSGLIGSRLAAGLRGTGHEVVAASPESGVNTLTGVGLRDALRGASTVVDVSNSPSYEDSAVLDFFETATRNLLEAGTAAGVTHHAVLSIVGTDRLSDSTYYRAKLGQEMLVATSSIPYSIVRSTQFFEFMRGIADTSTHDGTVRLPPALVQPIAADDVAAALREVALGGPRHGSLEVAGPQQFRLDDLVRRVLVAGHDLRQVVVDPLATYFGGRLGERSLVPAGEAQLGATRFEDWLDRSSRGQFTRSGAGRGDPAT